MTACGGERLRVGASAGMKAEQPLHSVMTVKPQGAEGQSEPSFAGVVKENGETSQGFRTGGTIEQILVKEGDRVRQGQLLERLDAKDYQLQVNAVQIQYDQMRAEVERLRLLFEGNSLSANDYEMRNGGTSQFPSVVPGRASVAISNPSSWRAHLSRSDADGRGGVI